MCPEGKSLKTAERMEELSWKIEKEKHQKGFKSTGQELAFPSINMHLCNLLISPQRNPGWKER